MADRIEVTSRVKDTRAEVKKRKIQSMGFEVDEVNLVDVYTLENLAGDMPSETAASMLSNPVTQTVKVNQPNSPSRFNYAVEIGFLPGVTDNVAHTARETIVDLLHLGKDLKLEVFTSKVFLISGTVKLEDIKKISLSLHNPLIEQGSIYSLLELKKQI